MATSTSGPFVIETLSHTHDRKAFASGVSALDKYLQQQARQDMARGVAVPYVLVPSANRREIAGFYTLSSTAVKLGAFPDEVIKKLPRYPLVPATLLGRLAVSQRYQGQRLGERLLLDALHRSLLASTSVASVAVIVDAKDDETAKFYERYGFKRFEDPPVRLFIAMNTVAQL